jgi:hypothetical protein
MKKSRFLSLALRAVGMTTRRIGGEMGKKKWVKGCKERGEWAELCFMARAAGMGMGVSKPLGDSRRYDVLVEAGGRILRVQVKSTIYRRRGNEYSLNVMGPGRKRYKEGTVDFFAVYLIPVEEWYIIPYAALGKKLTVHFAPGGKRQKYKEYREAWHLLAGEEITIQACADERWVELIRAEVVSHPVAKSATRVGQPD